MGSSKWKVIRCFGIIAAMLLSALALIAASAAYVNFQYPVVPRFASFGDSVWEQGWANFEGTWIIEGEEHAHPLNTSSITCSRDTRECRDSSAYVQSPSNTLAVDVDFFVITKWDSDTLIYSTDPTGGPLCVEYVYVANRATKQVSGMRKPKVSANGTADACTISRKELKLQLVDGFGVSQRLRSGAWPTTFFYVGLIAILLLGGWRMYKIAKERPIVG